MSRTSNRFDHEASEGKRRRANPEEEAQRKQQKCDIYANRCSEPVSYTQTHPDQELQAEAIIKSTAGGTNDQAQNAGAEHMERG